LLDEARRVEAAMAEVVAMDSQGGRRHAIQ
jgi:hypothetical protein